MSRIVLALALAAQLWLGWVAPAPAPHAGPGTPALLQWMALGDNATAARLAMLALQAADDTPGRRLALNLLDYAQVEAWLEASARLDPRSDYPVQAATLVYARVGDPARCRRMIAFIARQHAAAPARRRPWMEHAVLLARHHLREPGLAAELQSKLDQVQ
jgi:hypothetical protein